eukprot:1107330-Prorocentrum_minimum.AAC.3
MDVVDDPPQPCVRVADNLNRCFSHKLVRRSPRAGRSLADKYPSLPRVHAPCTSSFAKLWTAPVKPAANQEGVVRRGSGGDQEGVRRGSGGATTQVTPD